MGRKFHFIFLIVLLVLTAPSCWAQKLGFYDYRPARDSVQSNRALSSYNISGESDLYLLFSPAESLKSELAKLAPDLSIDELLARGNYRIDFLIDGKKEYGENLHPGALLREDKLTNRPIDIVLISTSRSGVWSINLWDRFMAKVGQGLLGREPKELEIQMSTYIDHNGIKYGGLIVRSKVIVTRIPKMIDPTKMGPQPIAMGSGFILSNSPIDKNTITSLNTRIAEQTYRKINAIVVLKKGQLLLEQYYNGEDRETLHDPRSVSKSITSTLTGLAIQDGYIRSADQYLKEFYDLSQYANYSSKKDSVRLIDLLSMSSAFDGNDELDSSIGNEENMYPTADYTKFTLDLPMDPKRKNGNSWAYFTAGTNLVMDVLDRKIPQGIEAYANNRLFATLGITKFEWARTPQGKPFGGGGLKLRALDFAKYGLLYANMGRFNGKRVLKKSWVRKSFSRLQVLPADRPGFYGLLFWNKSFIVNGKPREVFYSSGNGGNKIYIFKDLPIVIVITSSAYGTSYAHFQADEIVEKYLLPAIL